jgi:hypothetical protein
MHPNTYTNTIQYINTIQYNTIQYTMCDTIFEKFAILVGSLILLVVVVFPGFCVAWSTIGLIGIIIFTGFPLSAIFLDSVRWVGNNFKKDIKDEESSTNRLKKAAKIFIIIFKIMSDFHEKDETLLENYNRA